MPDRPEDLLTAEEQRRLLRIARETIDSRLHGRSLPDAEPDGERLAARRGMFVSLHKHGNLRGCIGTFIPEAGLCSTVQETALAAAFDDPRFPPLDADELPQVDIEISVLSPLREVRSPLDVVVGTHGVYITKGSRRGVLLPQVAVEYGWDTETFLDHTCLKAGLPAGAWRTEGITIEVFTAQVFGEKEGRG